MKFLVDECLSPQLVALARARGFHESMHVTWLGMRSQKDWAIVRRSVADSFVLVTNDTVDFKALYRREAIHPGLVCLNVATGQMRLDVQKLLFLLVLDRFGHADPINEVLEATLGADGTIVIERYRLPPT